MKDLSLTITRALPTANGTVTSTDFDLGSTSPSPALRETELVIEVPAFSAVQLPNATTITITAQTGAAASPTASANLVKVITGTGSVVAAQEVKFFLPPNTARFLNVKFVGAGGTGDCSALTSTISLQPRLLK